MNRVLRAVSALLAALLCLTLLVSCGAARPVHASPRASRTVAKVGDVEILYDELYFITMRAIKELQLTYGENALESADVRAELEHFVWESLRSRETALISLGYEYGLDVEKGDIADSVQAEIEHMIETSFEGDRKAYIEELNAAYMTDRYARQYFGVENYLATKIVIEMAKRGEVETDDAKILEMIKGEKFVRTMHVFISKSNGVYTDAENRAHAEAIRAEIAAKTDNDARFDAMFDAVGGKYNNDFGDSLGRGYYFTYGEMDAAYETAAFALAEYGVSDVIETDDGYYVLMRLPKDEAYITENFESLRDKSYFVTLNNRVDQKLENMTLEKTRFGKGLDLADLAPIDADGGSTLIVVGVCIGCAVILAVTVVVVVMLRKKAKKGA
ncbi:MAG: peptidylprolyl isomerase [Clostridia bacterium]|nr:peptidylprolyl isomerase [Clostridia bacterium]